MARFEVRELEGTHYVEIHLENESVRVEAGALNYMVGDIHVHSNVIPPIGTVLKSWLANESIYRPLYAGSGVITLESSLGGYHVLELDGETWLLERGAYWASEGTVEVGFHREPVSRSVLAGEGAVYLLTRVRGVGRVALTTRGPVFEHQLQEGERVVCDGSLVIARTGDVRFRVRRVTDNFIGFLTAGEGWVRVYEGTGRLLLNPAPFWRYRILNRNDRKSEIAAKTFN
ncbi:AIM24 family protein [Novipirellula artificiosorum]|uniref:AIM24 family protein n=1 Tax=Novipirellula artificiosorum TaxID=2528016 RepID=A0A5C6D1H7_9BACT|nr:AIM24 family protein [Novipirellula artificiosorum]TWU29056.1 hypothetical protein Poly41_67550 [Novipirellula artificiosorum]